MPDCPTCKVPLWAYEVEKGMLRDKCPCCGEGGEPYPPPIPWVEALFYPVPKPDPLHGMRVERTEEQSIEYQLREAVKAVSTILAESKPLQWASGVALPRHRLTAALAVLHRVGDFPVEEEVGGFVGE